MKLIELTTKSTKKLMVELPAALGLVLGKESQPACASILRGHPLMIEMREKNEFNLESIHASPDQWRLF